MTSPIGPAPGRPESGGGTKWAGASHWVPVCSSITSMSRCRPESPKVAVGTTASGVIPSGQTQGSSRATTSERSSTAMAGGTGAPAAAGGGSAARAGPASGRQTKTTAGTTSFMG